MDRISSLPDETIVHILSFVPVEAAARTSILSRRWRYLWTLNTALNIHASDSKPINYPVIFSRIIPKYQSPNLLKFSLIFDPFKTIPHSSFGLEHLFAFALSRGVRGLSLGIGRYQYPFRYVDLPRPFYLQGRSLQEVFLSWVNFCPPADVGFRELVSLTELSLSYSSICDETVSLLLSSCPLLESLRIDQCWGLHVVSVTAGPCSLRRLKHLSFCWSSLEEGEGNKLIVHAPNLVSLKYKGDLMKLELGSLPCLDQVGLSGTWTGELDYHHIDNLLEKVSHSRVFYTASWFAKYLSFKYNKFGGGKPLGSSTIAKHFRNLRTFSWVGFLTSDCDLGTLMAFFADCLSLETVVMDLSFCWGSHALVSRFELKEHCSGDEEPEEDVTAGGIIINGLIRVQVNDFYGSEREMKFLKLVLERASVLESLVVNFQSLQGPAAQDRKKKVEEQVCLWPRASPHVQIIFR